jgi:hypothetical protein
MFVVQPLSVQGQAGFCYGDDNEIVIGMTDEALCIES